MNTLQLTCTQNPEGPSTNENFCFGICLTRPRWVTSIISRIRTRSAETVLTGQQRVRRIISQASRKEKNNEEVQVTGNFGRTLKPLCPVSMCPIEECAIGMNCNHVQVFDLSSYVTVNQRMRSLDKRWTCPVCAIAMRPDDVVLEPFCQGILDQLRG